MTRSQFTKLLKGCYRQIVGAYKEVSAEAAEDRHKAVEWEKAARLLKVELDAAKARLIELGDF